MARGQALNILCPGCRGRAMGISYLGKWRRRTYQHGQRVGLPDSYGQWLVQCRSCGNQWWSRHPDARCAAGFPLYEFEITQDETMTHTRKHRIWNESTKYWDMTVYSSGGVTHTGEIQHCTSGRTERRTFRSNAARLEAIAWCRDAATRSEAAIRESLQSNP